jgi:hypothetical protein
MGWTTPAALLVSIQKTSSTWPKPELVRMAFWRRSSRIAMLSGMTPRDRSLSFVSELGLRLSSPLLSCAKAPDAEVLTVVPDTAALAPHTESPPGRAEVPQRSMTRKGASPFGGIRSHTSAGAWKPVVRRCCCEAGRLPPDPIRYTGSEQSAMA